MPKLETREERLQHFIGVMKFAKEKIVALPDNFKFLMGDWAAEMPELEEIVVDEHFCNFAGCALGWASSDPTFRKMGLFPSIEGLGTIYYENTTFEDFDAGAAFFFLTDEESSFLFDPEYYYPGYYRRGNYPGTTEDMYLSPHKNEDGIIQDSDDITPDLVIKRLEWLINNNLERV